MMKLLADLSHEGESMGSRNWNTTEGDRAYLSHHHSVEVVTGLSFEHGLFETLSLHTVSEHEYRNSFISMEKREEFSITTIVYPDSSTYTFVHAGGEGLGPVDLIDQTKVYRLSNADIKRPEGRSKRASEIELALRELGILPKPIVDEKRPAEPSGIVARKDADGCYVLDYSGVRSGKIESAARVLDYRKFNKVRQDDEAKPLKDGPGV